MSADLAKSLRTASSLSLHELQNMSRGDLMNACNVLHSGWVHVRQQVEQAALLQRAAAKDAEDARRDHNAIQEEYSTYVAQQTRSHGALESKHNALHREHLRLLTLLHKVDGELTSQSSTLMKLVAPVVRRRSLSFADANMQGSEDQDWSVTYGTDIEHVASEGEDDHTDAGGDSTSNPRSGRKAQPGTHPLVKVHPGDLEDLLSTIRSSKFRIADLEDSLTLSKSETLKLERTIRQRKQIDVSMLEFRVQQLETLLANAQKDNADIRDKMLRSEMTSASLRAELTSYQEAASYDDGSGGSQHMSAEKYGSMLSAASWTTATPTGRRQRGGYMPPRTGSNDRSFGIRADHNSVNNTRGDDDAFGAILSTSTGVQTESLVLQNVELLYKLQRDLLDLRTQRSHFEDEAARHKDERLTMQQRIELLEHEVAQKESQLVDAMEKRKRIPVSSYTRSAIVLNSNHGSFAADPRHSGEDAAVSPATPVEEIYGIVPGLRRTVDEQAEEIASLKSTNFDKVLRIEELEGQLSLMKESEHHLMKEVQRLTHSLSELTEDNARQQLLSSLDNEAATAILKREQSLRFAESRINELESAAEDFDVTRARITALERELQEMHMQHEAQHHKVLVLTSERNSALDECRELAELLAATDEARGSALASDAHMLRAQVQWSKHVVNVVQRCLDATMISSLDVTEQKGIAIATAVQHSMLARTAQLMGDQRNQFLSRKIEDEVNLRRANSMRDFRPLTSALLSARQTQAVVMPAVVPPTLMDLAQGAVSEQTSRTASIGPPRESSPFEADVALPVSLLPASLPHQCDGTTASASSSVAAFTATAAHMDDVDDDAAGLGVEMMEVEGALVVDTVQQGSAAYHAGLKPTDCVLCVDGAVVNTLDEFAENISGKRQCVLSVVAGGGKALLAGEVLSDALLRNMEDVHIEW